MLSNFKFYWYLILWPNFFPANVISMKYKKKNLQFIQELETHAASTHKVYLVDVYHMYFTNLCEGNVKYIIPK